MFSKASFHAVVLAAGLSSRMGRFKLTLPWGRTTVIRQVVDTLAAAGAEEIVVVTGHRAAEVADALHDTRACCVQNPDYANGAMLASIQTGLAALQEEAVTALICLGDQPQMRAETVAAVVAAGIAHNGDAIIIPSDGSRAGHPILLPRRFWAEVMAGATTLRDVLRTHRDCVHYLVLDTPTILADLDTPDDYEQARQGPPTER